MISVERTRGRLELRAPFHPSVSYRAKRLGGRWQGAEIGWVFAATHEAELRDLCIDIWGVDGSAMSNADVVDLRIEVDEQVVNRTVFTAHSRPIYLVGREIADMLKNRKAARPGRGVRFVVGKPRCVPGIETWQTYIPDGSVFVVQGVPRMALSRFEQAVGSAGRIAIERGADAPGDA